MTVNSSFQPFLIGQGQSKTGLFTYLDSWIKPEDAFDFIQNAYIYRGSIYQREGFTLFPSKTANGALVYQNNDIASTGNGGASYSGTLLAFPLLSGTVTFTAKTSSGNETWTDPGGTGTLTGSLGDTGTINYTTGAWTLTLSGGRTVTNNRPIMAQYNYVPTNLTTPVNNPIMGIKTFLNEINDTNVLLVLDTRRASYWNSSTVSFVPVQAFQQFFYQFPSSNAFTKTNNNSTVSLQFTNIAPFSVTVVSSGDSNGGGNGTVTDIPGTYPNGTFTSNNNISGGTINYATGTIIITFTTAPSDFTLVQITASLQGDYFTGNNTNFFNSVNWSPAETTAYLYLTNNKDFVTRFNGTYLSRPAFGTVSTSATLNAPSTILLPFHNDVLTTLDVKVYKNRLLFFRPTLVTDTEPHAQGVFFSALNNPVNFVSDISGNGGDVEAPTGDWIMCAQLLRDGIVVFFNNSTWFFRFTGSAFDPFRFDQLNNSRSTNAPYGSVVYDVNATSMGAKGLISCDGVGVDRYDINVIDQFLEINQDTFGQCFSTKFDTLNQTWMLYPSEELNSLTSDQVLVYNFLENTWTTYRPNLGNLVQTPTSANTLSCLGLSFTTGDIEWQDFAVGASSDVAGLNWSQATFAWNSYLEQDLAPTLLAGDQNGFVYLTNDGPTDNHGPAGSPMLGIPTLIQTKRLNPYVSTGEKARFAYLDVYYEVNASVKATFNFYINNSEVISKSTILTFDTQGNNTWAWKRLYINMVGEFVQIEINSIISYSNGNPVYNTTGAFKILGMMLWAAPAGRLTPGTFL